MKSMNFVRKSTSYILLRAEHKRDSFWFIFIQFECLMYNMLKWICRDGSIPKANVAAVAKQQEAVRDCKRLESELKNTMRGKKCFFTSTSYIHIYVDKLLQISYMR